MVVSKLKSTIHPPLVAFRSYSDPSHFVADCPKRNAYYMKGNGSGSNNSGGYSKPNHLKHCSRKGALTKNFRKVVKDYQKENKRRDKAFMGEVDDQFISLAAATSSSSSSSSSDEEVVLKKGGKKDARGPAGLYFMAKGHRCRSR